MNIIFFTHPSFMGSQSMPRYAQWLMEGMAKRGHTVEHWKPEARFFNLPFPASLKKWMGYIDQFIIFPAQTRKKLKTKDADTLFVFTDHAIGPWVPLVKDRRHIIHCHDFLAQRSALGEIAEVSTSATGRVYQTYIRKGYQKGKNFISVSENTRKELHALLNRQPSISEMVYNGLTQVFTPSDDIPKLRTELASETGINLGDGYLLHVGGNQWYKNRVGVVEIYNAWRETTESRLPLLMIGEDPSSDLKEAYATSPFKEDIHLLTGIGDSFVKRAYAGASLFIFPSLAEGFGWPIIEAMASGTPVMTTGEAPMTEVGGNAVIYLKRKPSETNHVKQWADEAAKQINAFFADEKANKDRLKMLAPGNLRRFDSDAALDRIEAIYKSVSA